MILSTIEGQCFERLNINPSPPTSIKTRIDNYINATIRETLADPTISAYLCRRVLPFVTNVSSAYCVLPQVCTKVHNIVDRNNRRVLFEVTPEWIRRRDPGQTFSSTTPIAYAVRNYSSPVSAQPAAQGQLTAVSSNAGDTGTLYCAVIGANGYIKLANVALNGTTPVNLGPTDTNFVQDLYLGATQLGEVTVLDSSSNTLAILGIGQYRCRFTLLEMYILTSAAVTLYADVDVALTDLVNATDECVIPEQWSEVIVQGVRRREYEGREKSLFQEAKGEYETLRRKLRYAITSRDALVDRDKPGFSQLGPYFPAGS